MTQFTKDRTWAFTVVRVHGLQHLRLEKSWRPIISVAVGDHQRHELSLGCDGQNPNLKRCFQFHDVNASSRIDISVYHQASSKKKSKKRNLVASARCTSKELVRLQAQQQCMKKSVEIKLDHVSRQKGGGSKANPPTVFLVVKLDLPEVCKAQPTCIQGSVDPSVSSEEPEDQEYFSPSTSDSDEDISFVWPEAPEPKVSTSYWSDSDHAQPEDAQDPLLKQRDGDLIVVSQLSDSEDSNRAQSTDHKHWFAASVLPTYTETISIDSHISSIDSIVDSFTAYRELREARVDSEYERVLTELCREWRFVGASLVALSGLEAGVFGFSSASVFAIDSIARRAIAVGSVASGIGLTIDAWFLLVYSNTNPVKFQKMAVDVYGKYLFFAISARVPALCMFTSALALMVFLVSVAWSAWPTAVLVTSFIAGLLVALQFIVYGIHCVVVFIADVIRTIQRGVLQCLKRLRPPPSDVREKHTLER